MGLFHGLLGNWKCCYSASSTSNLPAAALRSHLYLLLFTLFPFGCFSSCLLLWTQTFIVKNTSLIAFTKSEENTLRNGVLSLIDAFFSFYSFIWTSGVQNWWHYYSLYHWENLTSSLNIIFVISLCVVKLRKLFLILIWDFIIFKIMNKLCKKDSTLWPCWIHTNKDQYNFRKVPL